MTTTSSNKPHPRDLSPAPWPPQVGELVILYTSPESKLRGFVGWTERIESGRYMVRLLDSHTGHPGLTVSPEELISTGKLGQSLVEQYIASDLELSQAVENERTLPDFELVKPRTQARGKGKSQTKTKSLNQALKDLTPEQSTALAHMVLKRIKEAKK